jgi:16S rRNA (cytidine1402-2'-O)-methyltransferase
MGSGFNGQQFTFHGYLPIDKNKRQSAIQQLENQSKSSGGTQIFMEAPHRNDAIIEDVIRYCEPTTRFCTATNLTLPNEQIESKKISEWRKDAGESIHKEPTIFLLYAS